MSKQDNPQVAPTAPISALLEKPGMKKTLEEAASSLRPPEDTMPPKARPVMTVKIRNDDLADMFNTRIIGTEFYDGGPVSSQISVGVSFPLQHGKLAGSTLTGYLQTSISSAWGNDAQWTFRREQFEKWGVPTKDSGQIPTSERYSAGVNLGYRPIPIKEHQNLELTGRIDVGYVSGIPGIQNVWHAKLNNAYYLRSQVNVAKSQLLAGGEITAAHHIDIDRNITNRERQLTLLSGTALGNGGQSAMTGVEISNGSIGSHSFPRTSHSAQFGNNGPDVNQGSAPPNGAWKVSGYAKLYASSKQDYRTTLSKKSLEPEVGTISTSARFIDPSEKPREWIVTSPDGNSYNVETVGIRSIPMPIPYNIPAPVTGYDFKLLNFEAGVRGQYQWKKATIGLEVAFLTNPSKPIINPGYQEEKDRIVHALKDLPDVALARDRGKADYYAKQTIFGEKDAREWADAYSDKTTPKFEPFGNFTGEVSVSFPVGGKTKKDSGRGH